MQPNDVYISNQQPSLDRMYAEPPKKRRTFPPIAGAAAVCLLIVGILWWQFARGPSAENVFNSMLSTSLSTSAFKQVIATDDTTATLLTDYSDVHNPKIYAKVATDDDFSSDIEYYSTFKDTYVNYIKPSVIEEDIPQEAIGKWIQVQKNGSYKDGAEVIYHAGSADGNFFGAVVFGKFPDADRERLLAFLKENPVYTYQEKDVKKEKIDGHDVFVYKVKANDKNILAYNEKVGDIVGHQPTGLRRYLSDEDDNATIYIDIKDKKVLKVEGKMYGMKATVTFTFEPVSLPQQPKSELSYDMFIDGWNKNLAASRDGMTVRELFNSLNAIQNL